MSLFSAARDGNTESIRFILSELKFDVNAKDSTGNTALFHAIFNDREEAARVLIVEFNADVTFVGRGDNTLIHVISRYWCCTYDTLRLLVERGASIDARDKHGETALHHAIYYNYVSLARFLIVELGADVDVADNKGETPLQRAMVSWEDARVYAELLIEHGGADVRKTAGLLLGNKINTSSSGSSAEHHRHHSKKHIPEAFKLLQEEAP